mgnify:CR=1 FL=1
MEEPLQAGLARFISGCSLEKIPEKFKADARLRILDWAGCAIAGAHYPQTVIAGRYLSSVGGAAESTAIGLDDRLPARSAAFLNGVAGHVCELDDGHRTAIGHPGSVTIPVALALAEKTGATGADFLKAVIIGYDTMGTETTQDDVIIVADPYDTTDHNQDGYGVYGAERFLYNFTFYNFFDDASGEPNDMCFLVATPQA